MQDQDTRYNGWRNYETWNVKLWIDNDEYSRSEAQSMAQSAWGDASGSAITGGYTREERAALDLSRSLKAWIEEQNPIADQASMFADLLNAALGEVDWYEIAENMMEDVDKDDETEGETL